MFSDRIWPLRPRSRLSRMFLTKFASFWTRCLCFLFSMRSQIACCRSLRVRCRGVCRSHRSCFPICFLSDSWSFFLADTKLHPLDCSCLSHCSVGDCTFSSLFYLLVMLKALERWPRVSLLSPPAGSNYLKPLQGPLSNMLQMLQECSQLELALRVLLSSHGSCLQHITSNMMDMKLSVQVWPASGHINVPELQCVCWADNFPLDSLSALRQTSAEDL